MQVKQLEGGLWAVIEVEYDRIVISGFASNAAAWSWLDANTWDGRDAVDRDRRIRSAFGRIR